MQARRWPTSPSCTRPLTRAVWRTTSTHLCTSTQTATSSSSETRTRSFWTTKPTQSSRRTPGYPAVLETTRPLALRFCFRSLTQMVSKRPRWWSAAVAHPVRSWMSERGRSIPRCRPVAGWWLPQPHRNGQWRICQCLEWWTICWFFPLEKYSSSMVPRLGQLGMGQQDNRTSAQSFTIRVLDGTKRCELPPSQECITPPLWCFLTDRCSWVAATPIPGTISSECLTLLSFELSDTRRTTWTRYTT